MNRVNNWDPIVKIFNDRLASWKARSLSIGGRVVHIKAVLESLPIYFLSIFKAPIKVLDKLELRMRNFLWGGLAESRKIHWVAWDKVAIPKKLGGLGICILKKVNEGLLAKWIWRFRVEEDCLWRKVVLVCHGRKRSWSDLPCNPTITGVWKNITSMDAKLLLKGKRIHSFIKGVKFKECRVSDRIPVTGVDSNQNWCWSRMPPSPEELADLADIMDALSGVGVASEKDKWVWLLDVSDKFSTKSFKLLATEDSNELRNSKGEETWTKIGEKIMERMSPYNFKSQYSPSSWSVKVDNAQLVE
ncbi:uncharacterized protein LOC110944783 [Helianthus annuus]|uniref:uncharacterized protein LOC110944783 n=1 Tax=Helianthus annuus TaxID=4232 RepID=UPI000B8FD643|nr:uncharacterized protein LOC110944783 [Helianthus annuus]